MVNNLSNAVAIGANSSVGVSNAIVLGSGCSVGIGKNSLFMPCILGTDNGITPLLYMASSDLPSTTGLVANDGIFSVATGKPSFTSGTATYTGTLLLLIQRVLHIEPREMLLLNGTTGITVTAAAVTATSIILVTKNSGTLTPSLKSNIWATNSREYHF